MPSYQNVTPPLAVSPGDVGFSYNNEAFPGSAQSGTQFALSFPAGFPDSGRVVRWQTIFGTAPTAVNLSLPGLRASRAVADDLRHRADGREPFAPTAGEARTVTGVSAKFLRIKFNSSTGGAGLTAKILV
ncbi:MAG: hypothetical protein DMG33_17390 [Acidobacteria bacterium]|nr:MAG: hypothetical protein DMG33_17390 [Acidobacteriota bacterium]